MAPARVPFFQRAPSFGAAFVSTGGANLVMTWETHEMAEPTDDLVTVSGVQFVALHLACPNCGAPVAMLGQLVLRPDPQEVEPCCVCAQCGNKAYLVMRTGGSTGGAAPIPR
ncbi:MAG: hypothetical protein M3Q71_22465 [Chloroflexota bacterium]|nr:hypothetical protein [Chloroflexota bacterium]